MKQYIKTASVIILATLALASCSKTEEFQYNPDNALQIASVSGISPFTLMQNPVSKAVITGESLPGDEAAKGIGLFVTAQGGGAYDGHDNGYTNVKYTFDGSKWSAQSPIYLSDNDGKLYGYFPYNADATDLRAIPVASSLNGTDYLYADTKTVNHSNKNVSLEMNHALSRLHLTIKKGANFTANAPLSKITLKSTAIDATGTMDLSTGAVTASKKSGETGTVELATDGTITAEGIVKDILLVPADNSEGKKDITIILTIDGKLASVTLTETSGLDIRPGIQNSVTLTIEDTGIKVTGIGVGAWDDQGSQQIQVGAHTVTVKLSEDTPKSDVILNASVEGNEVVIMAASRLGRPLSCDVGNLAQCQKTKDNDIYTFTISNIASDIDAIICYAPVTITVKSDSNGKVWIGDNAGKTSGQFMLGETVTIHAEPLQGYQLFEWNDGNRNIERTITVNNADDTYSASFIPEDVIPHLFTVSSGSDGIARTSDDKQVFFSKGNLWADVSNALHFEAHQWDTTPTSNGDMDKNHVSHFTWSSTVSAAVGNSYSGDYLFCDESHKVSVDGSKAIYYAFTSAELLYLLDSRATTYGTGNFSTNNHRYATVEVNGMAGLLIFPDEFSWPSEAGEPTVFHKDQPWSMVKNYSVEQFKYLEDNGCVFLRAAGQRNNNYVSVKWQGGGNSGCYCSASPYEDVFVYALLFNSGDVTPNNCERTRIDAKSIRLVTDVKQ